MNITQSNLSADIDPAMDSELFSSPSWECSDPTMLYRDCLKEFLAEQSTSLICEQPPRILPSYRKGQWTLPSKIDRQTLFEQQPGVISGTGGPAKQRRWWASGDRSVDRGCPWTNYGRALSLRAHNRFAEACSGTDSWRSSLFSQLRSHFLNSHFRPAIAFVFSVSFLSFICYQFSSRSFTLVLSSTESLFLCQSFSGFRVQVISERSGDKWEVKWYLVIRSPRGVITEPWLAEWEKEPRPELQWQSERLVKCFLTKGIFEAAKTSHQRKQILLGVERKLSVAQRIQSLRR